MSHRFWLMSAATLGAAAIGGLGLGSFVTTPPQALLESGAHLVGSGESVAIGQTQAQEPALRPVGAIHCTGCGPTLAQRQMAAASDGFDADGYVDGTRDPVVRDYLADEPPLSDPPPLPPIRLPVDVERFAAGGAPPVVRPTIPMTLQDQARPGATAGAAP